MAARLLCLLAMVACAVAQGNSTCLTAPQDSDCTNYQMPGQMITSDINMVCGMMSNMPGCSLQNICKKDSDASKTMYCMPFAILKTLCTDMPKMMGCGDYTGMCAAGTEVQQCNTTVLPLGSTMALHSLIVSMCTEMPGMSGCSAECIGDSYSKCDLLSTYSRLCLEMPGMSQCSTWHATCNAVPKWSICTGTTSTPPEMRMYFHGGTRDYILFKFAVPESKGMYALAWILVALSAVLHEALKWVHSKLDKKWKEMKREGYASINSPSAEPDDFMFAVDVPRALMRALQFAVSYLLMLIAMTFNIGLCVALVFGIFAGNLLVGRHLATASSDCCA